MTDRPLDLSKLRLLVLDVDGVLTDGRIVLTPDGAEIKSFHVRDGSGIKYWQRTGRQVAIISGRSSPAVTRRAGELGIENVRLSAQRKLPVYQELLAALSVPEELTAVVGDDLPDIPLMRHCGLAVAVADAAEEVKAAADHVTTASGGNGAVREVIEHILKAAGDWPKVIERYYSDREGAL